METDFAAVRRRFVSAMVTSMGSSPEVLDRVGTTAVGDPRRTSNSVACYQLDRHTLIPFGRAVSLDAQLRSEIENLAGVDHRLDDASFRSWAIGQGASIVGQAVMKTRSTAMPPASVLPSDHRVFDWKDRRDLDRIAAFIGACNPDDLDEAELDLEDLDALAVGLLDGQGDVAAYASSRPFEEDRWFGDIGVIVRPGLRQGGWGRAVVQTLVEAVLLPLDLEPLYRCDPANSGSDRLSAGLGFAPALSLTVVSFPALDDPDV